MDVIPEEPPSGQLYNLTPPPLQHHQAKRTPVGSTGSMTSVGSYASSTGSLTRSGIKMGSVALQPAVSPPNRLAIKPPMSSAPLLRSQLIKPLDPAAVLLGETTSRQGFVNNRANAQSLDDFSHYAENELMQRMRPLDIQDRQQMRPHQGELSISDPNGKVTTEETSSDEGDDDDESVSDWEHDITDRGEVQHVVPYYESEMAEHLQHPESHDAEVGSTSTPTGDKSGKLSRLVRRRESRRDRNSASGQGHSFSNKTAPAPRVVLKTASNSTRPMKNTANARRTNSYESSDNESSTYGQIKTFEAFFEATNLDESVAAVASLQDAAEKSSNGGNSSESSRDATEIHEVTLKFNAKALKSQIPHFQMLLHGDNPANQGLLLEALLGIVPDIKMSELRVSDSKLKSDTAGVVDNSVVVSGYVPGGPAVQICEKIKIGDIIRSLDGHHVTLDSANTYLLQKLTKAGSSSAAGKVKLILQRPLLGPAASFKDKTSLLRNLQEKTIATEPGGVKRPWYVSVAVGEDFDFEEIEAGLLRQVPHTAMFISHRGVSENSPEMADILYQYPPPMTSNGEDTSPLTKVRGIFSTLCQLLDEILTKPVVTSIVISSKGAGDGRTSEQLVHVAYAEDNGDFLLLALPASKCTSKEVSRMMRDIVRVLRLRYGTLAKAIMAPPNEIDKFFGALFMDALLRPSVVPDYSALVGPTRTDFEETLPASQWLSLPDDIRFQVEDAMNQFESADFQDYTDDFYDVPREFAIVGSCVFHRGLLLASHLPRDDMVDIFLWLKNQKLLMMTETHPVRRVVLWQEVFPTRKRVHPQRNGPDMIDESAFDVGDGRTFLLVVGLGYQLLGVFLETGGCTTQPRDIVKPDPFYVDQAANTLEHLLEMGIPLVCERWITLPPNPDLLDADELYKHAAQMKKLDLSAGSVSLKSNGGGIVLRRTKSLDVSTSSATSTAASENDLHLNDVERVSNNSEEMITAFRGEDSKETEEGSSAWELTRGAHRPKSSFSNVSYNKKGSVRSAGSGTVTTSSVAASTRSDHDFDEDVAAVDDDDEEGDLVTYQVTKLSVSLDNTLIHYMHLDIGEGVFLAPLKNPATGQLMTSVLENFRAAAQIIHSTFQMGLRNRESARSADAQEGHSRAQWVNKSLIAVKEQAMLFRWTPVEGLPMMSYWVCGRLFLSPNPREFYVAYHESAPQHTIEVAFRLAFGMHL